MTNVFTLRTAGRLFLGLITPPFWPPVVGKAPARSRSRPSPSTRSYTNPAINAALYVKKSGTSYYSSKDGSTWYSGLTGSGTAATPPTDAIELTATDARGYARVGAPDLGAYEHDGNVSSPF